MTRVMSLEAALSRISQIETAINLPARIAASTRPSSSGGVGLPSGSTADSGGTPSFASTLQQAVAPSYSDGSAPATAALGISSRTAFTSGGLETAPMTFSPVSGLGALAGSAALLGGASASPAAQQIVQIAESQVGQSEQPPGSNDSPAIAAYRTATQGAVAGEPWCAYFASWAARAANEPLGDQGQGFGYVGDVWNWAQSSGRAIVNGPGVSPTPGDLIVFGDHHIGIVEKVLANGSIQTIEGNYANQVSRVIRGAGEASGYVRM